MHDFRRNSDRAPRQSSNGRQAIDGFLRAGQSPELSGRPLGRRGLSRDRFRSSTGRAVDDFRRPEGYHAASRQSVDIGATQQQAAAAMPRTTTAQGTEGSLLHMTLPGGSLNEKKRGKNNKKDKKPQTRGRKIRKVILRSFLVLLIVVLLGGGFLVTKGYLKIHKIFKGGGTAAALQADVKPSLLKGEGDGRVNVLLLGKGGGNHDGPDLTDTILVVSIDPINKTASMVSIPRDLWVTVPGFGSMKINAVYANQKYKDLAANPKDKAKAERDGVNLAEVQVTKVLGIPIHYYGMIDFAAFQQAVNTVGGVDINVPASAAVTDNMYNEDTHKPYLLNVPAGMQHFDGLRALMYVRTRHTSARGDFDRTERQRLFITALSQKILSAGTYANPVKISQLMSDFGDNVSTDFSVNDALRMMSIAKGIGANNIKSVGLADPPNNFVTTDNISGISIVRPTAGIGDYSQIQNYIRNTLKDPYIAKENAAIQILNGTSMAGLATTKSDQLKSYGYNVVKVGDAPSQAYGATTIVDLTGGKKPFTLHYLEERFGVKSTTKLPDSTIQTTGSDFVIILGQDATTNSSN